VGHLLEGMRHMSSGMVRMSILVKGVLNAVNNVNKVIAPELIGRNALDQEKIR